MEYTKVEWKATGNSIYEIVQGVIPEIVCYIQGGNRETKTNLIASCPDMYEALKAMNNGSFLDPENPDRVWERATPSPEAILKAFKALAKADGLDKQ